MGLGRHTGMQREAGYRAHRVRERFVGIARRQGLQGKHLAALVGPHGDAVGNGVTQQVMDGSSSTASSAR